MRLIDDANGVLREAGYLTRTVLEPDEHLVFENASVVGFVSCFTNTEELVDQWSTREDRFLRHNARQFRAHKAKIGNVYAIFLAETNHDGTTNSSILRDIEENLRATRKIARVCAHGRSYVRRALLPLLPISYSAVEASQEITQAVAARLPEADLELWKKLMSSEADEAIAEWLLKSQ